MPIFGRGSNLDDGEYVVVCSVEQVQEEEMTIVKVNGRKVILTRQAGNVFAIDTICPHAAADLSKGSLRSWQLCCHEHDYCFDIRTGRIVWPEDEVYRLRRYETKEADGNILVKLMPLR